LPRHRPLSITFDRNDDHGPVALLRRNCSCVIMTDASAKASSVRFGLLIAAVGGFLFTFDLPLLRLADNDKWTLIFARGMMLFVSITAVWYFLRLRTGLKVPYIAGGAGIAVIATNSVANIAYIGALKETEAANVVFILALVPVLTALFSRVFINEKIHTYTWAATALALFGVGIIVWDSLTFGGLLGDAMAFVTACCTAAAFTIIRASGKNVATSLAVGSLISALIAVTFFEAHPAALMKLAYFDMPSWFWVALNGLIIIPLSSALIANGPRFIPSADVSMFFLLETLFTPIWIWMLFAEAPSRAVLLGGGIVVVTLLVHSYWRLRETLRLQEAA
jgi:drug/metabolite transporter (DMT)-like permease